MHKAIIIIILEVERIENLPLDHTGFSFRYGNIKNRLKYINKIYIGNLLNWSKIILCIKQ